MNCTMNVVSYAQIAFKKLIFQARYIHAVPKFIRFMSVWSAMIL